MAESNCERFVEMKTSTKMVRGNGLKNDSSSAAPNPPSVSAGAEPSPKRAKRNDDEDAQGEHSENSEPKPGNPANPFESSLFQPTPEMKKLEEGVKKFEEDVKKFWRSVRVKDVEMMEPNPDPELVEEAKTRIEFRKTWTKERLQKFQQFQDAGQIAGAEQFLRWLFIAMILGMHGVWEEKLHAHLNTDADLNNYLFFREGDADARFSLEDLGRVGINAFEDFLSVVWNTYGNPQKISDGITRTGMAKVPAPSFLRDRSEIDRLRNAVADFSVCIGSLDCTWTIFLFAVLESLGTPRPELRKLLLSTHGSHNARDPFDLRILCAKAGFSEMLLELLADRWDVLDRHAAESRLKTSEAMLRATECALKDKIVEVCEKDAEIERLKKRLGELEG